MATWGMSSRVVLVAFVLLQASTAVLDEDGVVTLEEYNPNIQKSRLKEVNAIKDFASMQTYIRGRMEEVTRQQLARTDDEDDSQIEVGNTIKSMEAKHAVEEQLNSEVKVDCEVGQWGTFSSCSKACGGGVSKRSRTATRLPRNGGIMCPELKNTVRCGTEICEQAAQHQRAVRRKLTREEKFREMAQNQKVARGLKNMKGTKKFFKKLRNLMKAMVHTDLAEVPAPGDPEQRSDEDLVRKDLKAAMAKNRVDDAMGKFQQVIQPSQKAGTRQRTVQNQDTYNRQSGQGGQKGPSQPHPMPLA